MARLYFELISQGRKTLANVPAIWRAQVEALLAPETDDGNQEE